VRLRVGSCVGAARSICQRELIALLHYADASLRPSRAEAHGQGPMRIATPSSYRTFTDCRSPGALRKKLDTTS
jgi:hypothetical protein